MTEMADRNLPALAPAALPTGGELNTLLQIGDMLVKSGLLPNTLRTKEAAAVVVMKGNELGLPPMAAMEGISVVQGRTVIGAHLMLALVKRAYGSGSIWISETTNEKCTVSYRVPGLPEPLSYTYTMADARTAGLADKPTWRQHPAAMLRARAISATVKLAFPEVVGGMYVPGEIEGTEETVTPDGDVVIRVRPAEMVDIQTGEIVARDETPVSQPIVAQEAPQRETAAPTEEPARRETPNQTIVRLRNQLGWTKEQLAEAVTTQLQITVAGDRLTDAQKTAVIAFLERKVAEAMPQPEEPIEAQFEEVG